jgi:hypothetical protein
MLSGIGNGIGVFMVGGWDLVQGDDATPPAPPCSRIRRAGRGWSTRGAEAYDNGPQGQDLREVECALRRWRSPRRWDFVAKKESLVGDC